MDKCIAFIPVRKGSKSIPGKNYRSFRGLPLVEWAIKAALAASNIERVVVATNDEMISNIVANKYCDRVQIYWRSEVSSTDVATTEAVMLEYDEEVGFHSEYILLIQATSPFTRFSELSQAIELLEQDPTCNSILAAVDFAKFVWRESDDGVVEPVNYCPKDRPRRQDIVHKEYVETGAFYLTRTDSFRRSKVRISGRTRVLVQPDENIYELDTETDWDIMEAIAYKTMGSDSTLQASRHPVKMFVTDVDGVLTDSGMYYSAEGDVLKKFNTRDGYAIERLKNHGVKVVIITGELSPIVTRRAEKLGITHVHLGIRDKAECLRSLADSMSIPLEQVAYIGDDVNDLSAMKVVGYPACPANALPEILGVSRYICNNLGGDGCVREYVDELFKAGAIK